MTDALAARRVRFEWPDDFDPVWTPRVPELSLAANAVSMLMPYVEPYVVASTRRTLAEISGLDPDLAERARWYASQEAAHHGQHRRLNQILTGRYRGLRRVEGALARLFGFLGRRSTRFGLAYAAAAETIAFVAARWVDRNQSLLRDADPTAATLFLWHLAEEVEHKEVAFDLYEASGGGRIRYAAAGVVAALVLATGSLVSTWVMLIGERRMHSPTAHLRLLRWSLSFLFVALPTLVVSALPGHHPRDLADPAGLAHWLDHLDPETSTVPEWALP